MLQLEPTHIGLDIAEKIMRELQPETPVQITSELLEVINGILNKSIGLENAGLYRVSNKILTFIPYEKEILDRIVKNHAEDNFDIYLIHMISGERHCYCVPFKSTNNDHDTGIIECSKITV